MQDTYLTIVKSSVGDVFKDKGSRFVGYAFHVKNEDQIRSYLAEVKEEHYKARHWCYAWRLGPKKDRYRVNDDGEPNHSAGDPIYGQILSKDLTNTLLIVVRYFGGTKLGVGGLINAYKTSAGWALEKARIIEKTIDVCFELKFDYALMNKVMRIVKERKVSIIHQEMNLNCTMQISVRLNDAKKLRQDIEIIKGIEIIALK